VVTAAAAGINFTGGVFHGEETSATSSGGRYAKSVGYIYRLYSTLQQ